MSKFVSDAQRRKVMALMKRNKLKGNPISYEQKGNFHRVSIKPMGMFKSSSIRTKDIGKLGGVKALIGRPKGSNKTTIKTYLIPGKKAII